MEISEANNENYQQKKENILPSLLDQIFLICKNDDTFDITDKLKNYDLILESSKKKLNKKQNLLHKSKEIEERLLTELSNLENENNKKRGKLLNELGSEYDDDDY